MDSGDPRLGATAANNLGVLHEEQGDAEAAASADETAVGFGDPEYSPTAAHNLGVLRTELGDDPGAEKAYQAAFNLGSLLESEGDVEGAKAAYEIAVDYQQTDVYAKAKARLDGLG
jgi:predicted negative regulator of RcsB-dependent stress response